MPISTSCTQDDGPWSADHCAVWVEEMANDDGTRRVTMLSHPSYPFPGALKDDGKLASLEAGLRTVARDYIKHVQQRAEISASAIEALASDGAAGFGWLDLSWGAGEKPARDPRNSFWVVRRRQDGAYLDRTAILLAGQRGANGRSLGGEIGLRIVMHVSTVPVQGKWRVRVTSMSMSNLPTAADVVRIRDLSLQDLGPFLAPLKALYRFAQSPAIHGVALLADRPVPRIRIFGAGSSRDNEGIRRRSYSFVTEMDIGDKDGRTARTLARLERLSHARVFRRDPSSSDTPIPVTLLQRRPTRPAVFLDTFRKVTTRLPAQKAGTNDIRLQNTRIEVRQTRVGNDRGDPDKVQEVPVGTLDLRSDHLAAVHAFMRGRELFDRFFAYGIDPYEYFKLAKLPLLLRHRAPIRGAGDSKTVNAQVRPCDDGLSLLDDWTGFGPNDTRTSLEVCFAAGNLAHRMLLDNDVQRSRAQPLGLAADQRWAWHEFGHVLGFASTGALEFRFAHSAGDALAAVVADPDSVLARTGRSYDSDATYPWVHIIRRHNRDANLSWCWCGQRNVARLAPATALDDRRLGYFQEQLMSSSLFRFYRCIGGDTFADPATRRSASDYTVYLIMRAIALLGPEVIAPARTADDFVAALIDADIGTVVWSITANWPEGEPVRNLRRVGGCVHKVVRWAFEMQGMYATEDPSEVTEGPGLPPLVDIYIDDQRGGAAGGYEPVALQWDAAVAQPWHASAQGIKTSAGKVIVTVGNRGQTIARNVRVAARVSPTGGPLNWILLAPNSAQPRDVPVGGVVDFEFAALGSTGPPPPYLVWAVATCVADRATYDPAAGLPCSTVPTPLVDLIANDNNQGLRIIP